MCEIYKIFSKSWTSCTFTDEDMLELFLSESYGEVTCHHYNGFSIGKKYLSLSVNMWKEDIKIGNLFLHELYQDDTYPHWWLDSVFKDDPKWGNKSPKCVQKSNVVLTQLAE